jgi:protein TonB
MPGTGTDAPAAGQNSGPGKGGGGGGTGKGSSRALDAYVSRVRTVLDRNKKYPSSTGARSGIVEVSFTIRRDGSVAGTRIASGSGDSSFDDEALALVKRVTPFAPIPPEVGRESLTLSVPIVFRRR